MAMWQKKDELLHTSTNSDSHINSLTDTFDKLPLNGCERTVRPREEHRISLRNVPSLVIIKYLSTQDLHSVML